MQEVEQQLFLVAFRLDSGVIALTSPGGYFFQNVVQRIYVCSCLSKDKHRIVFVILINQLAELLNTEFQSFLQRFLVAGNVLFEQDKIITPQITAENNGLVHMQSIRNGIQRVSRYCRRAGTNNRLMFQFTLFITHCVLPFTTASVTLKPI